MTAVSSVSIAQAITKVAVGILMELGVEDPMPALNFPGIYRVLLQGFWDSARAGEEQVSRPDQLVLNSASCHDFHSPADPVSEIMVRCSKGKFRFTRK